MHHTEHTSSAFGHCSGRSRGMRCSDDVIVDRAEGARRQEMSLVRRLVGPVFSPATDSADERATDRRSPRRFALPRRLTAPPRLRAPKTLPSRLGQAPATNAWDKHHQRTILPHQMDKWDFDAIDSECEDRRRRRIARVTSFGMKGDHFSEPMPKFVWLAGARADQRAIRRGLMHAASRQRHSREVNVRVRGRVPVGHRLRRQASAQWIAWFMTCPQSGSVSCQPMKVSRPIRWKG
jgi:hypothetical protein